MRRLPLLALAFALLAAGVGGGLLRLGWPLPPAWGAAAVHHGALMVGGFFGTLISLERAVALRARWAYAGPVLAGAGGVALAVGLPAVIGQTALAGASAILAAASAAVVMRQPALFTVTIAAGAAAWLAGNGLWLAGAPADAVVAWWLAFFVLTIAGERLELSRVMPKPARADAALGALLAGMCAALVLQSTHPAWAAAGRAAFGVLLVALAAWLVRWDIARRTVRASGLTRYMAVALLAGYVWLAVGGALLAIEQLAPSRAGYLRDAGLHALLLGFVFSMVFAHAFVILPSVAGLRLAWRPFAYATLALLHAAVVVRVAGDLAGDALARRTGGLLNAASLVGFVLTVATCAMLARRDRARRGRSR